MSTKALWKCKVKGCRFSAPPTEKGYKQIVGHMLGHASKGVSKKDRNYALVDEETGNVLAHKIVEAKEKGLLQPEPEPVPEPVPEPEPTEEELQEAKIREYAEKEGITFEEAKARIEAIEPEPEPTEEELQEAKIREYAEKEGITFEEAKTRIEAIEPEPEPEPRRKAKEKETTEPQVSSDGIFRYTIALPSDAFTLFNLAKSTGLEKDKDKPFDEWIWDCITARYKYDYKQQLILAPILEEKT